MRVAFAGHAQGPLARVQLDAMVAALDESLAEGAVGFSTGLMYAPGSGAPREELVELCKVVARRGKLYCTHMRNYGFKLMEAIDEQIELAEEMCIRDRDEPGKALIQDVIETAAKLSNDMLRIVYQMCIRDRENGSARVTAGGAAPCG